MLSRSTLTAAAAAILAGTAGHAQTNTLSARWSLVGHTNTTTVYVDTATMTRDGRRVTAWVRYQTATPISDRLGKNYDALVVHNEFDCAKRTTASDVWATYTPAGSTVETGMFPPIPVPVMPGSIIEAVLATACEGVPTR